MDLEIKRKSIYYEYDNFIYNRIKITSLKEDYIIICPFSEVTLLKILSSTKNTREPCLEFKGIAEVKELFFSK